MGHTLSKMRQEKETLEKDLQTIGRMANYYNLEKNLENRAKKYIITNTKIMDELRPDDENKLLMKLNDELRTCNFPIMQRSPMRTICPSSRPPSSSCVIGPKVFNQKLPDPYRKDYSRLTSDWETLALSEST